MLATEEMIRWRKWIAGGPRDFWVVQLPHVESFIREHNLKPLEADHLQFMDSNPLPAREAMAGTAGFGDSEEMLARWLKIPPFPGGLRIPHLHFGREVYAVKPEQWREFSRPILEDFQQRLGRARTVGFPEMMELAEAVEMLH